MFGINTSGHLSFAPFTGAAEDEGEGIESYLSKNSEFTEKVNDLAQATMPILNSKGCLIGNCVAISRDLVLTSGHTVKGDMAQIGSLKGRVIFDGSRSGAIDFKILEISGANFKPAVLDVDNPTGNSIQLYFKSDESFNFRRYVKQFESVDGTNAARSDIASKTTNPGESGAPRMSLSTGFVHSVHQGESEGLKVNDIYDELERVRKNPSDPQQSISESIIRQITIANLLMIDMVRSTVMLKEGDVIEEKARVKGHVTISALRNGTTISAVFDYTEIGEGEGPRQITINRAGVAGSQVTYAIHPNPHDNKSYNKNGQETFYKQLATAVGRYYLENNDTYPASGTVEVLGVSYTLTRL